MARIQGWRRAIGTFRNLRDDRRGAVIIYVTLIMVVLLGAAGLVIDGGRLMGLHTEMQAAADAAALAAAAELDRKPDSLTRAQDALANLVQNDQRFAEGADAISIAQVRFLSELPDDDESYADATVTNDPLEVRFVDVMTETRSLNTTFTRALTGAQTTNSTARAIAGFDQAVCKTTPMFMCNPFETASYTGEGGVLLDNIFDAANDPAFQRRLIKLAQLGGNNQPAPGNFGYLDHPDLPGGAELRQAMALAAPEICFIQNSVDTKPGGTVGPVKQGINVRFDLYDGPFGSERHNPDYRPARNVRKGFTGPACNPALEADETQARGLPRDDCFYNDPVTCTNMGSAESRLGTGNWDITGYWEVNHGTVNLPFDLPADSSRYDVYQYELNNFALLNDTSPGGEDGNPTCSNSATTDEPDRRILFAAVINCVAELAGGNNVDVPVVAYARLFLTEPVGEIDTSRDSIFAELTGILEPGSGNLAEEEMLRDIVQLYR